MISAIIVCSKLLDVCTDCWRSALVAAFAGAATVALTCFQLVLFIVMFFDWLLQNVLDICVSWFRATKNFGSWRCSCFGPGSLERFLS